MCISNADKALYQGKETRKNGVVVYDPKRKESLLGKQ